MEGRAASAPAAAALEVLRRGRQATWRPAPEAGEPRSGWARLAGGGGAALVVEGGPELQLHEARRVRLAPLRGGGGTVHVATPAGAVRLDIAAQQEFYVWAFVLSGLVFLGRALRAPAGLPREEAARLLQELGAQGRRTACELLLELTREGAGLDYRAVVRALGLLGGTCKAHPAVEGWVLAFLASPAVEAGRVPCEAVVGVLLSLKAGTVNSILRFLQLLLRAAYAGHLTAQGYRHAARYLAKVAPGLPHCVDAVYESPARTCDFVDGLQLVLFPASFRLPAADGAADLAPAGALAHACHAALVRLSRRLDFLHWDQHPDLALSLHNLLGLLHDSLLSHRAAEGGGRGDPADGGQAAADPQIVAGRQQAHTALLKALEPPPASRANQTRLAREVQSCVEQGLHTPDGAALLQPLCGPRSRSADQIKVIECAPRELFPIVEGPESRENSPPEDAAAAPPPSKPVLKAFGRTARGLNLPASPAEAAEAAAEGDAPAPGADAAADAAGQAAADREEFFATFARCEARATKERRAKAACRSIAVILGRMEVRLEGLTAAMAEAGPVGDWRGPSPLRTHAVDLGKAEGGRAGTEGASRRAPQPV